MSRFDSGVLFSSQRIEVRIENRTESTHHTNASLLYIGKSNNSTKPTDKGTLKCKPESLYELSIQVSMQKDISLSTHAHSHSFYIVFKKPFRPDLIHFSYPIGDTDLQDSFSSRLSIAPDKTTCCLNIFSERTF